MHRIYLMAVVLSVLIVTSCEPTGNRIYPEQNQTADNGVEATSCGEPGDYLAMMAAPVVISQLHNGCYQLNVTTAIVRDDGAHSLANACKDLMHMELYYSLSKSDLQQLDALASSNTGSNFDLPRGVGRLVESRSVNVIDDLFDYYIQSTGSSGPNRGRYRVKLPFNIVDLGTGGRLGQNLGTNVQLHYRWAKRLDKANDVDPMVFSRDIYTISFPGETTANAGNDQTIIAPDENSVILVGSVNTPTSSLTRVSWEWIEIRQHIGEDEPFIDPIISSPNELSTNVIFGSHANHKFVLTVTDQCGHTSTDTVVVVVNGTFTQSASRNVFLLSGESCGRDGFGRIMRLDNLSTAPKTVRVRVFEDWRGWLSQNTPFAGQTNEFEDEVELPARQSFILGCTIEYGEGSTGADRVTRSWTIISER